ncbi:MAG: hypothetical protein EOO10_07335 [Chitinophagaceae bacterium]|nr:MAG: hypothetical protein EOO10_07335 [Chitinophagaceae bacterium]
MKPLLLIFSVFPFFVSFAQKRQELFDYSFKPANFGAYYYVVTEKEDSIWHRKAYYLSPQSLAMEGWYKDDSCQIEHGLFTWFHSTLYPKSKGHYASGKKQGVWMAWSENGKVIDSSTYQNNKRIGVSMHWYENGMARDSMNFDGAGNGVQVSWYEEGVLASAGFWMQDTIKKGRWKYYHKNGAIMATEDYRNGKLIASACYDENSVKLDSLACIEKEAEPAGGLQEWNRYIEYNLQSLIEDKAKVLRSGNYTVPIRFAVEKNGRLSSFTAFTNYGNELEEELIRILKKSPRWIPAMQHGRTVKSYFTQPFIFNIQSQYQ